MKTIHNFAFLLFSKNAQNCSFSEFNISLLAIKINKNLKKNIFIGLCCFFDLYLERRGREKNIFIGAMLEELGL